MKIFDAKAFNISEADNPVLADLYFVLREAMSERSAEQFEIDQKYAGVRDALRHSLSGEQLVLLDKYEAQVDEETTLAERQQFTCGFKTAFRLILESLK